MTQKALKILCLGILVLLLGSPSFAQNTKGDTPSTRETRFKTPKKQKQKRQPSRRVRRGDDRAGQQSAPPRTKRTGERPGKPILPNFSKSTPDKQRPWKGDITGRRIRPRSSASRARNVYPQPGSTNYSSRTDERNTRANENPNLKRVRQMQRKTDDGARVGRPIRPMFSKSRPPKKERAWQGDITGRKIRSTRSPGKSNNPLIERGGRAQGSYLRPSRRAGAVSGRLSGGRARNVFSGNSFWAKKSQRAPDRAKLGSDVLKRGPGPRGPWIQKRKVVPKSASASFLARRSTNPWAHFPRPKRKQERAVTTDLAGNRLRKKNFETQRPVLGNPSLSQRRVATGERPYAGRSAVGRLLKPRSSQRAWRGDITHRAIRGGKIPRGTERKNFGRLGGIGPGRGGTGIATYKGNIKGGRRPFEDQGEAYSGNVRSRRLLKGGGSVSGGWNNKGLPIQGRTPGKGAGQIGYQGNIRVGKRGFNDQGEEYSGNIKRGRKGFNDQGEEYSGNIKRGRRGFSDQGEEYSGNIRRNGRRGFGDQGEEYTGNIKARRPDKGGGSRSGKIWNNNETPIVVRAPGSKSARIAGYQGNIRGGRKGFNDQGEEYTGNIKAHRPDKGGGSVSGKLWNNKERSIPGKDYSSQAREVSRFTGGYKAKRPEKGGGSVSGKLWNNNETPIAVRTPKNKDGGYSGNIKIPGNHYSRNPNSAEGSLRGEKISASSLKAQKYSSGVRRNWDYIKNPSSADEAQRTREPGKAFYKTGDYQGNIKLKKFDLFAKKELHPDAKFVKTNKNNVAEEKDMLTNFKLWWARLFRKSETQPDHLKEKGRKPRYDNGEAGLWYE